MATEQVQQQHPPCPSCGGTGQINFFKGESRFLLSVEECPACCGFGYVQEEEQEGEQKDDGTEPREEKNGKSGSTG
ncbi:MAG: hypothetical protein D3909_14765 [Candidatus Electrothrix sp. ATG1]|nr:hypothetical protein [Candidatus Electrothrix sp. ATG1]